MLAHSHRIRKIVSKDFFVEFFHRNVTSHKHSFMHILKNIVVGRGGHLFVLAARLAYTEITTQKLY